MPADIFTILTRPSTDVAWPERLAEARTHVTENYINTGKLLLVDRVDQPGNLVKVIQRQFDSVESWDQYKTDPALAADRESFANYLTANNIQITMEYNYY
jgi:hypothetical protein